MEGPRTPSEIAIARKQKETRDKEREQQPKLEHMPGADALFRYLQKRGRGADCTDALHCNPEKYEPSLMSDLYAARKADIGAETAIKEVREVIWAGSWRLHKKQDPHGAAQLAERLKQGVEQRQAETAKTDPEEAKELNEEIARLDRVAEALKRLETGEQIEDVTRTVEDWFKITLDRTQHRVPALRKQAERELSVLRMLRDEVYYARLFPRWAQTRNAALRFNAKR